MKIEGFLVLEAFGLEFKDISLSLETLGESRHMRFKLLLPRGSSLSAMVRSIGRELDPQFLLPAKPWREILDRIPIEGLSFEATIEDSWGNKNSGLELRLPDDLVAKLRIDLGFVSFGIGTAGFRYDASGFHLTLTRGDVSGAMTELIPAKLEWDPSKGLPPALLKPKARLFELRYLGFGCRLSRDDLPAGNLGIRDYLEWMRAPVEEAKGPKFSYDAASGCFFGLDFSLFGEIQAAMILWDRFAYGIELKVEKGAKHLAKLAGFEGGIFARRIEGGGVSFAGKLSLPEGARKIGFPPLSLSLPSLELWLSSAGDFLLDAGFPANMDFSRSFGVALFPFIGSGGFRVARLKTALPDLKPVGGYNSVSLLEFGFGIKAGLGTAFAFGPLAGEISITISALFDGRLEFHYSEPRVPGQDALTLMRIEAAVGVAARIYGSVDLVVLAVRVDISLQSSVRLVLDSRTPADSKIEIRAKIKASGSVRIAFVTISKSLDLNLRYVVALGQGPALKSLAPRRGFLSGDRSHPEIRERFELPLRLLFAPALSFEGAEEEADGRRLVALPLISFGRKEGGLPSPFELFLGLLRAADEDDIYVDGKNRLVIGESALDLTILEEPPERGEDLSVFPMPPTLSMAIPGTSILSDFGASRAALGGGPPLPVAILLGYCRVVRKASLENHPPDAPGAETWREGLGEAASAGAFALLHGGRLPPAEAGSGGGPELPLFRLLGQQIAYREEARGTAIFADSTKPGSERELPLLPTGKLRAACELLWSAAGMGAAELSRRLEEMELAVGMIPPFALIERRFSLVDPESMARLGRTTPTEWLHRLPVDLLEALKELGPCYNRGGKQESGLIPPRIFAAEEAGERELEAVWCAEFLFKGRLVAAGGRPEKEGFHCVEILGAYAGVLGRILGLLESAEAGACRPSLALLLPARPGRATSLEALEELVILRKDLSTLPGPPALPPFKPKAFRGARGDIEALKALSELAEKNRGGTLLLIPQAAREAGELDGGRPEFELRFLVRCESLAGPASFIDSLALEAGNRPASLRPPRWRVRSGDGLASTARALSALILGTAALDENGRGEAERLAEELLLANLAQPGLYPEGTMAGGRRILAGDSLLDATSRGHRASPSLQELLAELAELPFAASPPEPAGGLELHLGPSWIHELPCLDPGAYGFRMRRRRPTEGESAEEAMAAAYHLARFRPFLVGEDGGLVELGDKGSPIEGGGGTSLAGPWEGEAETWNYEKTILPPAPELPSEPAPRSALPRWIELRIGYFDSFGNGLPEDLARPRLRAPLYETDPLSGLAALPGLRLGYSVSKAGRRESSAGPGGTPSASGGSPALILRADFDPGDLESMLADTSSSAAESREAIVRRVEEAIRHYASGSVRLSFVASCGNDRVAKVEIDKARLLAFLLRARDSIGGGPSPEPFRAEAALPLGLRLGAAPSPWKARLLIERDPTSAHPLLPSRSAARIVESEIEPLLEPGEDLAAFAQGLAAMFGGGARATFSSGGGAGNRRQAIYLVQAGTLALEPSGRPIVLARRPLPVEDPEAERTARLLLADLEELLSAGIAPRLVAKAPEARARLLSAKEALAQCIAAELAPVLSGEGEASREGIEWAQETLRQAALADLAQASADAAILLFSMEPPEEAAIETYLGSILCEGGAKLLCEARAKKLDLGGQPRLLLAFPFPYDERDHGEVLAPSLEFCIEHLECKALGSSSKAGRGGAPRWLSLVRPEKASLDSGGPARIPALSRTPPSGQALPGGPEEEVVILAAPIERGDRLELWEAHPPAESEEPGLVEALRSYKEARLGLLETLRGERRDSDYLDAAGSLADLIEAAAREWLRLWPAPKPAAFSRMAEGSTSLLSGAARAIAKLWAGRGPRSAPKEGAPFFSRELLGERGPRRGEKTMLARAEAPSDGESGAGFHCPRVSLPSRAPDAKGPPWRIATIGRNLIELEEGEISPHFILRCRL